MQKLWKVVQEKGVISAVEGAIIRLKLRHPEKSLRRIAADLEEFGMTNGGGKAYHPYQIHEKLIAGTARLNAYIHGRQYEASHRWVAGVLREKPKYSCSTKSDPYLSGRLEWWKFRKTGRKPSSTWYDRH